MTNPEEEMMENEMVKCEFCTTPYVPAMEYMQHMKQLHPGCAGMWLSKNTQTLSTTN